MAWGMPYAPEGLLAYVFQPLSRAHSRLREGYALVVQPKDFSMNQAICRGVKRLAGTAAATSAAWSGRAKAARATLPRVPEPRPATLSTPDGWAEPPAGREITGPAATGPAAIAPAAVTAIRAMAEPASARVRRGNVRPRVLLRNTGSLRSGAQRALGFHPGAHTCPQREETKAAACGRDAGAGRLVAGGDHHAR